MNFSIFKRGLWPLVILAMFVVAGCDDDDDNGNGNGGNGGEDPPPPAVVYDTTDTGITITDEGDGVGGISEDGTVTWTSDFEYTLENFVYVNEGQTLTIEPGTVIRGAPGQAADASALVVAQGGTIQAEGTAEEPIIFTSAADDLNDPADQGPTDRGQWGGVVILGNAPLNTDPGTLQVEGIPTTETRATYGGDDPNDNSGVLRYVSIRYGGTLIAEANEINGLTLGGVGAGTTIEFVEVFANLDDGIEWFGGTVNTKYLVSAFVGDDMFDSDQGYQGANQYWFGIQAPDDGDNGAEQDGGEGDRGGEDAEPLSTPLIWNATYIGTGLDSPNIDGNGSAVYARDNSAPTYICSYFTGFQNGVRIEDLEGDAPDSRARFEEGQLSFENNLWGAFAGELGAYIADDDEGTLSEADVLTQALVEAGNVVLEDPDAAVTGISREANGGLVPTAAGDALGACTTTPENSFIDAVDFIGAVPPDNNWLAGWTALSQLGFIPE